MAKVPKKMGRPKIEVTKKQMRQLISEVPAPYLVSDICEVLGISNPTYQRLMAEDDDFSATVTRLRDGADDMIENELFLRAQSRIVETTEDKHNPVTGDVDTMSKQTFIPSDVKAINLWLMNRRPKDWRNKVEVEVTGSHVQMIEEMAKVIDAEYEDVTDDE
jgi:hypothetical protein